MIQHGQFLTVSQKTMIPFGIIRFIFFAIIFVIYFVVTKLLLVFCDPEKLMNNRLYNFFTIGVSKLALLCMGVISINIKDEDGDDFEESLRIFTNSSGEKEFRTLIPNHTGAIDVFLMPLLLGTHANVSTHQLSQIPFFGGIIKLWGGAFVDKTDPHSREKVKNYIKENIDKYPWVIYPERGDNRGKELLPFKSVAFSLDKELTPVVIDYGVQTYDLAGGFYPEAHPEIPPRTHLGEDTTYEPSFTSNFIKCFLTRPFKVLITVLNPTKKDSEEIRKDMAKVGSLTLI